MAAWGLHSRPGSADYHFFSKGGKENAVCYFLKRVDHGAIHCVQVAYSETEYAFGHSRINASRQCTRFFVRESVDRNRL